MGSPSSLRRSIEWADPRRVPRRSREPGASRTAWSAIRRAAARLEQADRTLNMDWVSPAGSWQNDLWMYRATGDQARRASAAAKADRAIAARLDRQPTDFSEAGAGTFFDDLVRVKELLVQLFGQEATNSGFARAHRPNEENIVQFGCHVAKLRLIWYRPRRSVPTILLMDPTATH